MIMQWKNLFAGYDMVSLSIMCFQFVRTAVTVATVASLDFKSGRTCVRQTRPGSHLQINVI